jgi:hypothetical protein
LNASELKEGLRVVGYSLARSASTSERVLRTVALLRRRGYALRADRLGELCIGGAVSEAEVHWAVAASAELTLARELVVERSAVSEAGSIHSRAVAHQCEATPYLNMTTRFVRTLVAVAPFIRSVSVAGSLASGGFRASDDVDLNLIVDDGHRHLAYVAVNALGLLHALAHRGKPVDDLTRRPLAPRLMTANLILERSQCFPLERQDEDMAYELLVAEPLYGLEVIRQVLAANPALLDHFPQLACRPAPMLITAPSRRLPAALFPTRLDGAARLIGRAAWRYMQWTRRYRPDALARVAFVRATMRPYTLFDGSG